MYQALRGNANISDDSPLKATQSDTVWALQTQLTVKSEHVFSLMGTYTSTNA